MWPFPTCKWGVANDPIFWFLDCDLPIHYVTFMGLWWRLRAVYRWASPLLRPFRRILVQDLAGSPDLWIGCRRRPPFTGRELGQKGTEKGHVTHFWNPSIFAEWLPLSSLFRSGFFNRPFWDRVYIATLTLYVPLPVSSLPEPESSSSL